VRRILAALAALLLAGPAVATDTMSHGRFKDVRIERPEGEVRAFVLLLESDEPAVPDAIRALVAQGAMVADIDAKAFYADLEDDGGDCVYPDGDLENLARHIEAYYKLPGYFPPIVAGFGASAPFAYAIVAQSNDDAYGGALSVGFCPSMPLKKQLCKSGALDFAAPVTGQPPRLKPAPKLTAPWTLLQTQTDLGCSATQTLDFSARVKQSRLWLRPRASKDFSGTAWLPQFSSAVANLIASLPQAPPPPPSTLADLPITEVPVDGAGQTFAVLISGDGGWAGLDKEVAGVLATKGIPVVGIDSLRYFWTPRTPAGLATDLDRVIRHYAEQWKRPNVLLVGYSQGADVMPFAFNRLAADTRARVRGTALMALSQKAAFEFHLSNWVGDSGDLDIAPEVAQLSAASTLCIYGEEEDDSLCPEIGAHAKVIALPGGHHFDGDYEKLANLILGVKGP
jgi:type IV secretory pathway VirJ component